MKKVPKRVKPVAAATLTMGCLTLAIPLVTNTFGIELWASGEKEFNYIDDLMEDFDQDLQSDATQYDSPSRYRAIGRTHHKTAYYDVSDSDKKHVSLSGLTHLGLGNSNYVSNHGYPIYGQLSDFEKEKETTKLDIYWISIVDGYGRPIKIET